MKHYHKARLKKLAEHLKSGKLGHKKFDFGDWNRGKYSPNAEAYKCGYAGCAVGECPIVFPKNWKFNRTADPVLRGPSEFNGSLSSAEEFFGINSNEAWHLFMPGGQAPSRYGGRILGENAKASSVANNILAFLAKQD